jgi:murein DD-endopeptidase MepM/ murein hydrolase activator NlpD
MAVSPHQQAGLVVALSTLAVVTAMAVGETFTGAVPQAAPVSIPVAGRAPGVALRRLAFPVRGFDEAPLRDTFNERRGVRRHHALDIMAPRGTPVVAVEDGRVAKLARNPIGGITLYLLDREESRVYYYAHLQGYAPGIAEGSEVSRGDVIGFVGSTGNAPERAPHLHFAIHELREKDARWWKGKPVNPYPLLK